MPNTVLQSSMYDIILVLGNRMHINWKTEFYLVRSVFERSKFRRTNWPIGSWFPMPLSADFLQPCMFILSSVQYSRESQTAAEGHVLNLSRTRDWGKG